ncbi:hypothetical protein [Paremcibacter congregatus]|uniref:STAS/SEC14 domain-containing protein n=1 Tax=Paremcibacter congregatus TaxID=2043170 RepID=A0A2G4YQ97_9PROT|nr:hypothetical protein [Paremcibacter congregatus]PHZ84494.1 hypothetical protein CRD36_11860 [Paremcibacter congregatus]QDE28713.1 hypothetical protein FIV45_16270 [Paremcibacter congregatus]
MVYMVERQDTDIISVIFNGAVALAERKEAVNAVCSLCHPKESPRILVDVREITMNMSLDEQQYFGEYLANREELADAKVAVLHNGKDNPNAIIDACAYGEGYYVAEFNRLPEAVAWLQGAMK